MEQQESIPPNGNGRKRKAQPALMALAQDIKTNPNGSGIEVLKEIRNTMRGNTAEERTKFTIAHGLQDDDKVHHFTEYRNWKEENQLNKLELFVELMPIVFPKNDTTKEVLAVFKKHVEQHKRNMRSYMRKGEKAIVDILRADNGQLAEPSWVKKFSGVGK